MALLIALWGFYLALIGYQLQDWFAMRKLAANLYIVDEFFIARIAVLAGILLVSILLKTLKRELAAKVVVALPIGLGVIALTWMVLVWVFVWGAFMLGAAGH